MQWEDRASSPALASLANATAAYPLILIGLVHGQWLLSWWALGHQPRPSLDDPCHIAGASWMHWVTGIAFLGHLPVLRVAAVLNSLHALRHRNPARQLAVRIGLVATLWLVALMFLRWDPGLVVSWWCD